jgi:hypothetical protein
MEPRLLEGVLGHGLEGLSLVPATAPGYRTVHYPGRIYPALVPADGATAAGLAVAGLSAEDMEILDLFEGDEYIRQPLGIRVGEGGENAVVMTADTPPKTTLNVSKSGFVAAVYYRPLAIVPADAPKWSFAEWRRRHGEAMIVSEGETAATLRRQLIEMGGKR